MKGFSYTSVSSFDTISGYSKEVSGFFYKLFFKKQINQACAPPGYTYHCEKRSPAEGRGARPFSTSGNLVRSGRFRMWDINSSLTTPTFSSLCFDSWKKRIRLTIVYRGGWMVHKFTITLTNNVYIYNYSVKKKHLHFSCI